MKLNLGAIIIFCLMVQSSYGGNFLNVIPRVLPPYPGAAGGRPLPPMPPRGGPVQPPMQGAEPVIQMDLPSSMGNGCPAGTVASVLSPDKQTLSVIFDQYVAEAGPSHGRTVDIKNCILKIPLHIMNGSYSVRITSVDYRGAAVLPPNSSLQVILQDAIQGARISSLSMNRQRFVGPYNQDFLLTVNSPLNNNQGRFGPPIIYYQWSVCDRTQELNLSSRMELQNNTNQDALASMDSIDVSTHVSINYKLEWRLCSR